MVRRLTSNQEIEGSSPSGVAYFQSSWRNGSVLDFDSKGCGFKSRRRLSFFFFFCFCFCFFLIRFLCPFLLFTPCWLPGGHDHYYSLPFQERELFFRFFKIFIYIIFFSVKEINFSISPLKNLGCAKDMS